MFEPNADGIWICRVCETEWREVKEEDEDQE
jgi:ribosomal protein L37AE/L43A